MKKHILKLIVIYLTLSCNSKSSDETQLLIQYDDSTNKFINIWKSDSNGCLGYRNHIVLENILSILSEKDKSIPNIIMLLGEPNVRTSNKDETYFSYFFSCVCDNNLHKDSIECYMSIIIFDKDSKIKLIDNKCL